MDFIYFLFFLQAYALSLCISYTIIVKPQCVTKMLSCLQKTETDEYFIYKSADKKSLNEVTSLVACFLKRRIQKTALEETLCVIL